jgi:hypothetical protein
MVMDQDDMAAIRTSTGCFKKQGLKQEIVLVNLVPRSLTGTF